MAPLHWCTMLPMSLSWPIKFVGGPADALRWAHRIGRCCCRLLHFGPLYLWKALPIHSDGPIASADAAADGFDSAYYFLGGTANALRWAHCIGSAAASFFAFGPMIFVRRCRCILMGPFHFGMVLLIAFPWALIFF